MNPTPHRDTEARIVVIGEALIDIVRTDDGVTELPGGSPANVAVTLGRLGRRPTLLTSLGDDARGRLLRSWLETSGVEVIGHPSAAGRTSTARATIAADGSATYDFDLTWDVDTATVQATGIPRADVVHTGSVATVLQPGAATVETALRAARGHALVTFDPNARPSITTDVATVRADVERFVTLTDLVKVSDEDLRWYYPDERPVDAARRWATTGPVVVVVTLGGDGAVVLRGDRELHVPGRRVEVADTIGAGDTFMGALIDALATTGAIGADARQILAGLPEAALTQAATWAAAAASITVSRPGANPPTREELTTAADTTP